MFKLNEYSDYFDNTDPNYPNGKAVDTTSAEGVDGTPLLKEFMNDMQGAKEAVYQKAFNTIADVSGVPDNINASDFLRALLKVIDDASSTAIDADKFVKRDSLGRGKVAPPEENDDIARLDNTIPLGMLKQMPQLFSGDFSGVNPINVKTGIADTRWQLCDGTNGTPDLRNRFIRGGTGANQGTTGGSETHNHTVTVANRTLSISQLARHPHSTETINVGSSGSINAVTYGYNGTYAGSKNSNEAGSNGGHNHEASSGNASSLPSYYTLAYIIYIGD